MNKFLQLITSDGSKTLERRATTLAQQGEIAQKVIINNLEAQLQKVELTITNLTDLAPESKDSLLPGGKNWDADAWANALQEAKCKKYEIEVQLRIAKETLDDLFKEVK